MKLQHHVRRSSGFALIEAMIALMILSIGLLGIVKIQSLSLTTGTDTKSKATAIALVESRIDLLRNRILKSINEVDASGTAISGSSFDAYLNNGTTTTTETPSGSVNSFTVETTISSASSTINGKLIQVTVSWDDLLTNKLQSAVGNSQSVTGRTIVSWDDPALSRSTSTGNPGTGPLINVNIKTPTGVAQRGDGSVDSTCTGCVNTQDGQGTKIRTKGDGSVELRSSSGALLLTLLPSTTATKTQFTTISGKIYVDKGVSGFSQSSSDLSVRLSSEGVCLYNNATPVSIYNSTATNPPNNTLVYEYFSYICYVSEGWYGNVGIWNASNINAKICVGDPTFNSGNSDGTLISPHSAESSSRSYRGFKSNGSGGYYSTGVLGGSTYPTSGLPQPSSYASYGINANAANNYFNHDFLVTKSNQSCVSRMTAYNVGTGKFARNAGQYFCISPDESTSTTDLCPSVWPGFESQVSGSGGTNYMLSVNVTGSGTVASNPAGISCNSGTCSSNFSAGTAVSLTATPAAGYSFTGWSGACTGVGTCDVSMSSDQTVSATFTQNTAGTYQLSVSMAGSGSGTVTSSPAGINCTSGTCTANFSANTLVTLTASTSSSTFTGWSGSCSGSNTTCTVTLDTAKNVTATFAAAVPTTYNLSVSKSGSGTVTSTPAGISCGSTCTYGFSSGTAVTLTAAPGSGYVFGSWSGACSGSTSPCTVTMSGAKSVTATFYPSTCQTTISGAGAQGNVSAFTISPTSSGSSCTKDNGTNFHCTLTHAGGTSVSITYTGNQTGTLSVTTDCNTNTNINFP